MLLITIIKEKKKVEDGERELKIFPQLRITIRANIQRSGRKRDRDEKIKPDH